MKVAYMGVPGAFGHQACLAFLADHEPVGKASFADVIASVCGGEADCGILPVENSCAGPVEDAQRLISECPLVVRSEHMLPVRVHLLALPGVELREIDTVASHPVAIGQCAETLARLNLATRPAPNTAVAAQTLASRNEAVLASEDAAAAYGLTILRRDVHDRPDNATRFVVLARERA